MAAGQGIKIERDKQKDYLGKIHQIVADGLGMLRNLLGYRRTEEPGILLSPEPLNVTAAVTAVMSLPTLTG